MSLLQRLLTHPRFLFITFGLFIAIRLALIFLVPTAKPFSDADWYWTRAITLVEQGTYSERGMLTAYWPVGYPAFLALLFKVTGPSILAAQLANLLLAAGTFWLMYWVVRVMFRDELVARAAVMLLTLYPNNAAYVPILLTETLFTFLLLLGCFCLLSARRALAILLGGCVLGLAILVKTQTLLLIPLLALLAGLHHWSIRDVVSGAARAVAVTLVALVVVTPWMMRNYHAFGAAVLATNGGLSLLAGNNPSVVGDYSRDYSDTDPLFKQANANLPADQIGSDQRARALAYAWIKAHPGLFVQMMPKKIFRLWAPDGEAEWMYQDTPFYERHKTTFRTVRYANQAYYFLALLLCAFAGWKLLTRRAPPVMYLGFVVILVFTAISMVFSGQSRYHFPAMPFVLAYSAWVLFRRGAHSGASTQGTA